MKKLAVVIFFLQIIFFSFPVRAYDTSNPGINGCVQSLSVPDPDPSKPPKVYTDVPSLACLAQVVSSVIDVTLVFLGSIAALLLLFGAIRFITSSGDPKAIQGAQKLMTYAIIGILVVLLSALIVNVILQALGLPNIITGFTFYQP